MFYSLQVSKDMRRIHVDISFNHSSHLEKYLQSNSCRFGARKGGTSLFGSNEHSDLMYDGEERRISMEHGGRDVFVDEICIGKASFRSSIKQVSGRRESITSFGISVTSDIEQHSHIMAKCEKLISVLIRYGKRQKLMFIFKKPIFFLQKLKAELW